MTLLPTPALSSYPTDFFKGGTFYLGDNLTDWWLSNIAGISNNPGGEVVGAKIVVSLSKSVIDISVSYKLARGDGYSWKWHAEGDFEINSNAKTIKGTVSKDYDAYQFWNPDGTAGSGQWKLANSQKFVNYGASSYIVPTSNHSRDIPSEAWRKYFSGEFNYNYVNQTDTVFTATSSALNAKMANLILTGTSAINGTGNALDNILTGNSKNNVLSGGGGKDNLTGISANDTTFGKGTVDTLTGGTGGSSNNDTFVLGTKSGVFYSDGNKTNAGRSDYAWITDFTSGDKIQLQSNTTGYQIKSENMTINGKQYSGFGLYLNDGSNKSGWDSTDELIGFIQTTNKLALSNSSLATNQGFFSYI